MIGGLGPTEIMIIAGLFFLLFGAKKIPELARGMGQAQREFQRAKSGMESETLSMGSIDAEAKPVVPPEKEKAAQAEAETPAKAPESERERVLAAAKAMGVDVEGRSLEEIKAEVNEKMGG